MLVTVSCRCVRSPALAHVTVRSLSTGVDVGKEDIKSTAAFITSATTPAVGNEALKRGTGGRSSFNGTIATVFGTGQLGSAVLNRLGRVGTQVIIPYRGDPHFVKHLKLVGDLGQMQFTPFHLRDDDSIFRACKYSNVVVNTIHQNTHTANFDLEDVFVDGARRIARIAREAGVKRLIHVSALNCHPNPKPIVIRKGSEFFRTKYLGEVAVKEEFPTATIIRPADIFGPCDNFLNYYGHWYRRSNGKIYLWNKGKDVFKMPVFNSDVAEGIFNAIFDDDAVGKTYDAIGPQRYQLHDIVHFVNQVVQKDEFYGFNGIQEMKYHPLFHLRVYITENLKKYPILCWERIERENTSDVPTGNATLQDLGVKLTPMEDMASTVLDRHIRLAQPLQDLGDNPAPDPIPVYPL